MKPTNNTPPPETDAQQPAGKGLDGAACSRILNALRRLYDAADAYVACQDRATDERCGLVQPITVADGNELIAAQCEALEILQSAEKRGWLYSANVELVRPLPAIGEDELAVDVQTTVKIRKHSRW